MRLSFLNEDHFEVICIYFVGTIEPLLMEASIIRTQFSVPKTTKFIHFYRHNSDSSVMREPGPVPVHSYKGPGVGLFVLY